MCAFFASMKVQRGKGGGRTLLGDNTGGLGGRTVADPVSVY